jgi:predicted ATPase/class 3 adenylate cyclase
VDVGSWLHGLGLGQYEQAFRDNDIGADLLPTLTADELRELGVVSLGHRKRLLAAIVALAPQADLQASALPTPTLPPASAGPQAERRQLTVMFVDLVGSTALSARLDPEEMSELLRAYQDAVTGEIARFGGHVAKFLGDGVLAYFGFPQAHEDEAERAVRTGLAIIGTVARQRGPDGEPLVARVGIATGLVVVGELIGEGPAQERAVVGETPNLAARLQALAEPGAVVVAERTRQLVGELFTYADLGSRTLKGFATPVRAWRVTGLGAAKGRFEALRGRHLTPLVGREQELNLLLDRWRRAANGEGQVVLLSGEAGIGKSRLVRALRDRLASAPRTVLRYQCSPHHTSSALWPVIEQLESAVGISREEPPAANLDRLEALIAQGTADTAATIPLLAHLLGLPAESRYPAQELSPRQRKARTFDALLAQLAGLAARGSVLVVLEDAHWIDPSSQELFDQVVQRLQSLPVLLVVTFRPEFRPAWAGQPHATLLILSRLQAGEALAVAKRVAGGRALPASLAAQIVVKTDGVPLFVEELTKTVLEAGLLHAAGGHLETTGPLATFAIPSTLHDSLLARLDRLAPVKEVAQLGAVIGREFGHTLFAAVSDLDAPALASAIDKLAAAELVFVRGEPPEAVYTFKHALVQDAAYASLLKPRRQQLHARIAAVLEERFPETAETQAELLAHHFTQAGLAEKAVGYWHKAGRLSMARSAMLEAEAQLTRGLGLLAGLPAEPNRDRMEVDLRLALGGVFITTKGWAAPEVGEAYMRARDLCPETAQLPQLMAALSGLWTHHLHRSGAKAALKIAEALLRLAERQGDTVAQVAGHRFSATSLMFNGRLLAALPHFERSLALYDPAARTSLVHLWGSDTRTACLSFMALILLWQGYPEQALARGREALAAAQEAGHPYTMSQALFLNCWLHQGRGEARLVRERGAALIGMATEHGFPAWLADGTVMHGWALAAEGEVAAGVAEMRQGAEAERAMGLLLFRPSFLSLLAGTCSRAGDHAEALALLAEALAIVDRMELHWFEAELHRLKGEALLARSRERSAEAEASLRKAIEVAQRQDAKWRELRAVTSLARLWADRGERENAHDLLAPVYGWFTEGFDTPDLREAKALLQELAAAPRGSRTSLRRCSAAR